VDVIRRHPEIRQRLWANTRALRRGLVEIGYTVGDGESPIVAIFTGDERRTVALWDCLLASGVYVNVILPPGCPQDDCVLRASCSAAHTTEQVGRALDIFAHVARELGVERVALS